MSIKYVAVAAALFAAATQAGAQAEKLTPASYARLRGLVDTKPGELAWQQVAWRGSFFVALVEAQAKDRPIFFWIYEGDPRKGC